MIKEVTAFEINGKIFATKEAAEKYKFEQLDDVGLGDEVVIKGFFGEPSQKWGIVCCIEEDKIYFAMNGMPPKKYLGHIKNGFKDVEVDGKKYSFDIGIHPRRNLVRKMRAA